jgi:hypothetical protein
VSQIGIVVSQQSRMLRRLVIPSADRSEIDNHPISAGEEMLVVDNPDIDLSNPVTIDIINGLVMQQTGVMPPSSRCAVVVMANAITGNVTNAIHADPAIDAVPSATLISHPTAVAGWTWTAAQGLQPPIIAVVG